MKTYPLFKVHAPVEDALHQLELVLRSGFINEGAQVVELTAALQKKLDTERLLLTNSGTSALTLALKMSGVGPGDEVISTPMTCVATNTPIVSLGANVVWADVDPDNGMVAIDSIVRLLNARPKVKAVMAVAWAGTPPDLEGLSVVRRSGRKLILDAAHAFDAWYRGMPIHRWADYTCYSFQAIKHFTTGDGGALVCDTYADFQRAKALKWFGLDRDRAKDADGNWKGQQWDVDIVEAGYKFNMNNVAAAIGLAQLKHIDKVMALHRRNAAIYDEMLRDYVAFHPATRPEGAESSFWVYTVRLDPQHCPMQRDDLLKALNAEGIMAGVVHVPNDDYTCFAGSRDLNLPGLRSFADNQLSLPCGWWMTEDDVRYVARRFIEVAR